MKKLLYSECIFLMPTRFFSAERWFPKSRWCQVYVSAAAAGRCCTILRCISDANTRWWSVELSNVNATHESFQWSVFICAANAITCTLASICMASVTNAGGSRTPTDSLLDDPSIAQYASRKVTTSSGHGEISPYELTENSKDYKGTLALNCWNDLWFCK